MKPNTSLIHKKIYIRLLGLSYLKSDTAKLDFTKKFFHDTSFINKLDLMIKNEDYGCSSILDLFYNLLDYLSNEDLPSNLLYYIYQYTLHFSFPAAVEIDLDINLNDVCNLYLEILKIFSTLERTNKIKNIYSKYPLVFLTDDEEYDLINSYEYKRFKNIFLDKNVYEMMKLNKEVTNHNTLEHISGVSLVAMSIGRQLKAAGVHIDMGRVCGAAIGHDIGKYGCKVEESKRVPYLHYYYTDLWFKNNKIQYIGHIAVNHSTWDLELENLSLESLVLIYSDFRVKNKKTKNEKPQMHIFSLEESFDIVLNKLDNLDEDKKRRYQKVYNKLHDFEYYMVDLGINVDWLNENIAIKNTQRKRKYYSLMHEDQIIDNIKYQAIEHNINLMYQLRNEVSLTSILELARSENDWMDLRGYIQILEEYSTYLTQNQKIITIKFLYDLLIYKDEDIRKQAALLIGKLIAEFDEEYRKEVPQNVQLDQPLITSYRLLDDYVKLFLNPDHKILDVHREWITFSLRIMLASLLANSSEKQKKKYRDIILKYYENNEFGDDTTQFYLLQIVKHIPYINIIDKPLETMFDFILYKLSSDNQIIRLSALERTYNLLNRIDLDTNFVNKLKKIIVTNCSHSKMQAENYLKFKIASKLNLDELILRKLENNYNQDVKNISDIFLKNLKSATSWITKKINIQFLLEQVVINPKQNGIYTAMHLCNLLKVSSVENVRNHAGDALVKIAPFLSLEERNDVTIELLRALEIEGYHFTRYIPEYLGKILLFLQPSELDEIIYDFIDKTKKSNFQITYLIYKTIGIAIQNYKNYNELFPEAEDIYNNRLNKMLGMLLNGLASFDKQIKRETLRIIGIDIFGSTILNFKQKHKIAGIIGKKLLTLLPIKENNELLFFNNSASINYIYRFIADYTFFIGKLNLKNDKKIAFFPGTFDPFTLGHKEIAKEIRNLGFEVYLAVDEFSWSKKAQPHELRENIISMSIADETNIYLFPQNFSINIANPTSLKQLTEIFDSRKIYIAVGSDVVLNASGYKKKSDDKYSILNFAHLIFSRKSFLSSEQDDIKINETIKQINNDVIKLTLPPQYEDISSTQIRSYIDENRDISELIDPLAQKYIYKYGIYRREPQYKTLIKTNSLDINIVENIDDNLVNILHNIFFDKNYDVYLKLKSIKSRFSSRMIIVRDLDNAGKIIGFSAFHWVRSNMIYNEFKNSTVSEYIRQHSVGRLIVLDGIYTSSDHQNLNQVILTETLAFCLAKDYTYALYKDIITNRTSQPVYEILKLQGFKQIPSTSSDNPIMGISISNPCTLSLDVESVIKEPFRSNPNVKKAITRSRKRLQMALTKLYPNQLTLSFDRNMTNEAIVSKICKMNDVPTKQQVPRILGENMCVPFGSILNGYIVPNTVTKSMHTEKMFRPNLRSFTINAYPYYMNLENQIKMIKAFDSPIILVDDLLNKGYRMKVIDPLLKKYNVKVVKILVGLLSGRGKELMDIQNREADSAYFIPNLNLWFKESLLYPFIGGDSIWRGANPQRNLLPSMNLILPYASPSFIKNADNKFIYYLSKIALINALDIVKTMEKEYQARHQRSLTLQHLGEIFIHPRYPDHGQNVNYDWNINPSKYITNDLEHLQRLEDIIIRQS
ncbi:nicotinate-nicotinamide nucleotide adenylyltransferase [Abyssisolibacter fermentans]|uniref:nicotinate-nicotinamide nucleotide adenylyltransferase n=1 Tax=Abyssisolibacter fermentans TaxID=1766203 RepID=UPI0008343A8A|nr:adenylyltransferase/cytidyltransferase family protein [Abyssisolibacter fermentans]